jgi:hypothetical protein
VCTLVILTDAFSLTLRSLFNWDISYANAQEVFGPSYAAFQTLEYVPSVSSANAHLLAGVLKGSNIRHCRTFNE